MPTQLMLHTKELYKLKGRPCILACAPASRLTAVCALKPGGMQNPAQVNPQCFLLSGGRAAITARNRKFVCYSSSASVEPGTREVHPLELKAWVDSGSVCVEGSAKASSSADRLWALIADPSMQNHIHKSLPPVTYRLHTEQGRQRRFEMEQEMPWKLLRWGGVFKVQLWMDVNEDNKTVSFSLREPGFVQIFQCTWCIVPASHTEHSAAHTSMHASDGEHMGEANQLHHHHLASRHAHSGGAGGSATLRIIDYKMRPKCAPPGPLGMMLLKRHACSQVRAMVTNLLDYATRLEEGMLH